MISVKHDNKKQKWEETGFPLVCETCLGDNPYIRMTKEPYGKPCKICDVPFTVFAWQAGTYGRLKKVEICKTCAKIQHVCQVCVFDLRYGLPVQLRDKILQEEGAITRNIVVSRSDANRSWQNAQNERKISEDSHSFSSIQSRNNIRAVSRLQSMARMEPRYDRNLAKLCSFYARGECNRGSNCPFRHEHPRDRNDPLSKQNTKDRFYGINDPVATSMIGKAKEYAEKRKEENRTRGDERSVSTCYIRFGNNRNENNSSGDKITEIDVRDGFYSFGEISAIKMHGVVGAFVEYTSSEATELAISGMNRKEWKGRILYVNWARQPKRGNENSQIISRETRENISIVPPPGEIVSTDIILPEGFNPSFRPSSQRKSDEMLEKSTTASSSTSNVGISRFLIQKPGIRPIRHMGSCIVSKNSPREAAPKLYYPSTNPGRLGTHSKYIKN